MQDVRISHLVESMGGQGPVSGRQLLADISTVSQDVIQQHSVIIPTDDVIPTRGRRPGRQARRSTTQIVSYDRVAPRRRPEFHSRRSPVRPMYGRRPGIHSRRSPRRQSDGDGYRRRPEVVPRRSPVPPGRHDQRRWRPKLDARWSPARIPHAPRRDVARRSRRPPTVPRRHWVPRRQQLVEDTVVKSPVRVSFSQIPCTSGETHSAQVET